MNDDPARRALEEALAADLGGVDTSPECADADTLWRAALGELPVEEMRALAAHVVTCGPCTTAWLLARAVAAEADPAASAAPAAPGPRPRARGRWALIAAAAVVMVGLLSLWPTQEPPSEPALRAAHRPEIVSELEPGAPLPREAFELRWKGVSGARYSVDVATTDLTILARTNDLDATSWLVPPEALRDLPPGALIEWQVQATLPDGSKLASRTFVNRVP